MTTDKINNKIEIILGFCTNLSGFSQKTIKTLMTNKDLIALVKNNTFDNIEYSTDLANKIVDRICSHEYRYDHYVNSIIHLNNLHIELIDKNRTFEIRVDRQYEKEYIQYDDERYNVFTL